jgi:hypothetical protein
VTQDQLQGVESDQGTADGLAAALLPVLIHRMNNATQLMTNLSALAGYGPAPGGGDWLEERAEDLASTSREIDEVGYLLAVLASASGADLLLERRCELGLSWMTRLVADALRREGRSLAGGRHPIPGQRPGVGAGWELCWALGALLMTSGMSLPSGEALEWQWLDEGDSWVLVGASESSPAFRALLARVQERLPEGVFDARSEGWSWRIPAAWLTAPSGA